MLLKIDQELKDLIPPLASEDRNGLENNIKANGCETPITVWDGTIIDGHNRYEICIANGIPFEVKEMHFADKDDAKVWMIKHELEWKGRKITPYIRSTLALKMENIIAEKAKANKVLAGKLFGENHPKEEVLENSTTPLEEPFSKTKSILQELKIKLAEKEAKKPIEEIHTRKEVSKIAQVSENTIARVKKIEEKATAEVKKELEHGTKSINDVYKEIKKEELQDARKQKQITQTIELPTTEFNVILADPPWQYSPAEPSRRIENQYPTMADAQIYGLKIPSSKDCVLFLWATTGKLPEALKTMESWGFQYKSSAVWNKMIIGMGYYFRGQHEFLLVGTKGNPGTPEQENRYSSIIEEKRTEHSKKPEIVYEMIEKMYPGRKYLEMFARNKREGWESWGNEV